MEIVVKGRNVEVPDHYRQHVADKLGKVERYDQKIIRIDVELFHERNRRQSDYCQRVEITCVSRGPVIRAEACAKSFYAALDTAVSKIEARLRRVADRRRVHHGRHTPVSVAAATAPLAGNLVNDLANHQPSNPTDNGAGRPVATEERPYGAQTPDDPAELPDEQLPGKVVREKVHAAQPMTVDDALFEMELVGHDFYLFLDKESGKPSVVYRRRGYHYGVIRLSA